MKEYVIGLTALAFLASIIASLSPDQGKTTHRLKFLCSLVLISSLISPLIGFVESVSTVGLDFVGELEVYDNEQLFIDSLAKLSADELESSLADVIAQRFDIERKNVSVDVEYRTDGDSMTVTRAVVRLTGAAILKDPYEIEAFVLDRFGLECDVI